MTDGQLLEYYRGLYSRPEIQPLNGEFVDLTEADFSAVTPTGLSLIATAVEEQLRTLGVESHKTAVFAPKKVQFGMARAYEAWADSSVEEVMVFDDREQAIDWLCS